MLNCNRYFNTYKIFILFNYVNLIFRAKDLVLFSNEIKKQLQNPA